MEARKLVRSLLVRFPRVYDGVTGQWRYRMYYRLGIVHEYEFRALPALAGRLDPLVLDIGGNNGQSVLSIKRVLPDARVITFEPARRHRKGLESLAKQLTDVEVRPYALANADGEAELHWPVYNGMPMHALASLDREEAASWLGPDRVYGFKPELFTMDSERVVMRRLDTLDLEPDILKIDVQGTEADVLAGGLETIRRSRPSVMAEALGETGPARALLDPLGYELYTFRKGEFAKGVTAEATNQFLIPAERVLAGAHAATAKSSGRVSLEP